MENMQHFPFWVAILLMMSGFYTVMSTSNLIKKMIGLSLFQTSVLLFYVSASKIKFGAAPVASYQVTLYSNPLPHVLMLTAIVVGLATLALGLALIVRIRGAYGSIEEEDIIAADSQQYQMDAEGQQDVG